jgi:transposase
MATSSLLPASPCSDRRGPVRAQSRAPLVAGANYPYRYADALDVGRGRVLGDAAMVMGVSNLRTFLRKLRRTCPTQTVFLIWDNWLVHQHPAFLEVASLLDIQLRWLPTYAPWTNPIEKLGRWPSSSSRSPPSSIGSRRGPTTCSATSACYRVTLLRCIRPATASHASSLIRPDY